MSGKECFFLPSSTHIELCSQKINGSEEILPQIPLIIVTVVLV